MTGARPRGAGKASPLSGLLLLLLLLIAGATLAGYVALEDPSFGWSEAAERPVDGCRCLDLRMRSQTWRGIPWDHTVSLVVPPEPETPQTALLFITGEEAGVEMQRLGALL